MSRLFLTSIVAVSWMICPTLDAQVQEPPTQVRQKQQDAKQDRGQGKGQGKGQGRDMGAILIRGLKKTKGCIDVKTCQWSDGKQSIVAWFENKKAAVAWYNSSTHQAMIGGNTDGSQATSKPLAHVKNADQPIMVIASLTPSTKPELEGFKMPISQISIEMFAPLPGGAQVNGRVSPAGFKVPHMRDYTPPKKANSIDVKNKKTSDKR